MRETPSGYEIRMTLLHLAWDIARHSTEVNLRAREENGPAVPPASVDDVLKIVDRLNEFVSTHN